MMKTKYIGLAFAVGLLFTTTSSAQVIHLPTFSQFSVGTTVVVPDSGAGFLGGVKRARYGSTTAGVPMASKVPYVSRLFRNRGIGTSLSHSSAHVRAHIIDHAELDEAVLSEASALRLGYTAPTEVDRKAAFLSRHIARGSDEGNGDKPSVFSQGDESVAAIRARRASSERKAAADLAVYIKRAKRAEEAGNWRSAQMSYEVIGRRATGPLKQHALTRLAVIRARQEAVPLAVDDD